MSRMSLRARLILLTVTLLAAGLMISDIGTVLLLGGPLQGRVDNHLRAAAGVIAQRGAASLPRPPAGRRDTSPVPQAIIDWPGAVITDVYVGFLNADGELEYVMRSASFTGPDPPLPRLDAHQVALRQGQVFTVTAPGGTPTWRAVALPRDTGSVVVAVVLNEATTGNAVLRFGLIDAALLAVLALIGWFAIGAGLRPLRRIGRTAAAIATGDLSHRVPDLAAPHTEIGQLATSLNAMLAQLDAAFSARADSEARMRRFVADASHELRTPLFGISGFAELYRLGALTDPEDVTHTMQRIEHEAKRLAKLVNDLLLLAQLDDTTGTGTLTLNLAPMDLRTLAADALHDLTALDPTRPTELTGPGGGPPAPAPAHGDEARLRQVVTNLIGNATTHTPPGTPVRIGVGTVDGSPILEIQDHGSGLTDDQTRRVFDRFYRADTARARPASGGAGLGLSIAHSLVAAHHGRIELDTAPDHGATFRIVLPNNHGEMPATTEPR
ncbi:MAG: HAMP domain-containing histidine kinase [Pseudonocardia sp.]|nr:HAMP domain-containing histidine kinase [Pseudonocardia sp.]